MSSFTYCCGSGAVLSLKSVGLPTCSADLQGAPRVLLRKDISVLDVFDAEIDTKVNMVFDSVLNEIVGFFLSSPLHRENIFGLKRATRKIKTAIVQCNAAEVCCLVNGVLKGLQREIGEHMLIKSGRCSVQDVMNRFENYDGKRKQLLVIEQAESLSSGFLNGLFYSLATLQCEMIVLLCISTKQTMFTSRVSRRCLATLCTRRFFFSLSKEVFHGLLLDILLNPSFTDLRPHPELVRFLRSSFVRDDFSATSLKKCVRFALLCHLWSGRTLIPDNTSESFTDCFNKYMDVLAFLHDNLYRCSKASNDCHAAQLIKLHENLQRKGFHSAVSRSDDYRNWIQHLLLMPDDRIMEVINHEGIVDFGLELQTTQNPAIEENEMDSSVTRTPNSLNEKTSVFQLKNKMEKIIMTRQRNPHNLARQTLISDIENVCKSTLQPNTSFPQSNMFLFGSKCADFLTVNIATGIESSLLNRQDGKCPLNLAVRSLLEQGKWKTVPLSKWGRSFAVEVIEQGYTTEKEQIESLFFACVGQLEHLGIIRASCSSKIPSVTIVHHILSLAPNC